MSHCGQIVMHKQWQQVRGMGTNIKGAGLRRGKGQLARGGVLKA